MNWFKRIQAAYYGRKYTPKKPYIEVIKYLGKDIVYVFNSYDIKGQLSSLGFKYMPDVPGHGPNQNRANPAWQMPLDIFKKNNILEKVKQLGVEVDKPIEPLPEVSRIPTSTNSSLSMMPETDLSPQLELETPEEGIPSGPYADTVNVPGEGKFVRVFNSYPIYQTIKQLGFQFYDPRRPRKAAYRAFGNAKIWYMSLDSILSDPILKEKIMNLKIDFSRIPEIYDQPKTEQKEEKIDTKIPEKYLTSEQRDVQDTFLNTNNNEMIEALAGTGKSSVLRHLSSFKKPGEKWLYLVFGKKNQLEAAQGVKQFAPGTLVLTSHAFLGRVLDMNAKNKNFPETELPKRSGDSKQKEKFSIIVNDIVEREEIKSKYQAKKIVKKLGELAKSYAILPYNPNSLEKQGYDPYIVNQLREIIEAYSIDTTLAAEGNSSMDYTDKLIEITIDALRFSLPVRGNVGKIQQRDQNDTLWFAAIDPNIVWPKFDVVLADEVQDFNRCQIIMLKRLKDQGARIIAVGDKNQSVFAFRGADFAAFDKIKELVGTPENNGIEKQLTKNFRCGRKIIDYVNQHTHVNNLVAGVNYDGEVEKGKKEESLLDQIQKEWLENGGKLAEQMAIISRINKPLIEYALHFMKNDINFTIIGRDLATELINQVKRVTGSGRYAKNMPIEEFSEKLGKYLETATKKMASNFLSGDELNEIRETVEAIESILIHLQQNKYHDAKINFTVSDSDTFIEYIRRRFEGVDTMTTQGTAEYNKIGPRSSVILTTAHKAKGMEWNRVYIVRPDLFPHPKAETEQEKRQEKNLWYVALTRARNLLSILAPKEE